MKGLIVINKTIILDFAVKLTLRLLWRPTYELTFCRMSGTRCCQQDFEPSFGGQHVVEFSSRFFLAVSDDSPRTRLCWTGKKGEVGGVSVVIKMHSAAFSRLMPPACSCQISGCCSGLFFSSSWKTHTDHLSNSSCVELCLLDLS